MGMRELVIPRENPVNDYFEARVSLFKSKVMHKVLFAIPLRLSLLTISISNFYITFSN